ncbi:polysaccharide biosynthesis protein [Porifericola rhodea]|uniref:polysaccharide biosynthesis protein n=1 Tax=Porifericola rhodea TaxID=930972 RepID=UPI0026654923|nr:polysaccharide biosynthesis protein [Porifericola rhodea]WKN31468.1 polysaccharide biosynthesis protein [Porifericola rhodea]
MNKLTGKSILVTGGTGSFGQALIGHLLGIKQSFSSITVFSRDEYKQYQMRRKYNEVTNLRFIIGDVRDEKALTEACRNIDVVIHAAALKQNISGEVYPEEFIKTNIDGTRNLIRAAVHEQVEKVIALSTDKAVYPTTLYGASKLSAEKLLVGANEKYADLTQFAIIRLGNLFGSRGSVLYALNEDSAQHEVRITQPKMSRFSLSMEEGVHSALKVLECMKGGEVFVPKMSAYTLEKLVRAMGLKLAKQDTGPRLTEKIHEQALSSEEVRYTFEWENFYIYLNPNTQQYQHWKQTGKKLPETFEYRSDLAPQISISDLQQQISFYLS